LVSIGRKDCQIKIQGYRVELGAMEAIVRTISWSAAITGVSLVAQPNLGLQNAERDNPTL